MKIFNLKFNVGSAKYLVSYHNGEKFHPDGSEFFDIAIFKNKKKLNEFIKELKDIGYVEQF